jgi:hypothetical protein
MFPTIHHNDLVLIDTTQNIPQMSDQVFAVSYCGLGCVKRLRPTNDGGGSSSPITQPSPPSPPMTANSTFWAAWSRSSGRCDPRRPDGSHRLPPRVENIHNGCLIAICCLFQGLASEGRASPIRFTNARMGT